MRLEEVYESQSEIYLVQELCLGGELFDRLDEQPDYHYTEAECARLVKQMLSAVRYLHSRGTYRVLVTLDLIDSSWLFQECFSLINTIVLIINHARYHSPRSQVGELLVQ